MRCRVEWLATCPCTATSLLVESPLPLEPSPPGQALLVPCAAVSDLGLRAVAVKAQAVRAKSASSGPCSSCGKVATLSADSWDRLGADRRE